MSADLLYTSVMPGSLPELRLILRRSLRRALRALVREGNIFPAFAAFTASALLLQVLLTLFLASARTERSLVSESAMRLDLLPSATAQETQEFFAAVRHLPNVASALYVTKEQALEDARTRDPAFVAFLEEYQVRNPFTDTILVRLRSVADNAPFHTFVRTHTLTRILDPAALAGISQTNQQMQVMAKAVSLGRAVLAILLALATVGFLGMTVEFVRRRLRLRHDEALLEQLAGAPLGRSLLPLTIEVAVLLVAVCVMSSALLFLVAGFFPRIAAPLFLVQLMDVARALGIALPGAILLACAAAGVGTTLLRTRSLSPT